MSSAGERLRPEPERPSRRFRNVRISILLLVLAFVGLGTLQETRRLRSWTAPLTVAVFPIAAQPNAGVERYLESLNGAALEPIASFFAREAARHDAPSHDPLRFRLGPELGTLPPPPPSTPSVWAAIAFSLKLRWYGWRAPSEVDGERADLRVFWVLHPAERGAELEHSVGLERGSVAAVHGFASEEMLGANQVVIAHELLHLVGARDKYEPASGEPVHPEGYADPWVEPRYPQSAAEIMGGRIPQEPGRSRMPKDLGECRVGAVTAREIGWVQ